MCTILVLLVDDTILVEVFVLTFQRLTCSVILLLVDKEGARRIAHGVNLHRGTCPPSDTTGRYALVAGDIDSIELSDTRAVGANVIAYIPCQTVCLYRGSTDSELKALTGDVTDVGEDTVREVSTCRCWDLVE